MDPIVVDALSLLGLNMLLWLVSLPLGKTWPVDFIWSNWPIYQASIIYSRSAGVGGDKDRQILVFSLVCVWGFRLTNNFYARGGIGHEDWRYADMREKFGDNFWWISLFSVFLGQTIFLFLPCLSLYGAIESAEPLFSTAYDIVGFVFLVAAILLETISDQQMNDFVTSKKLGKATDVVINKGLWRLSRHPNYLGEMTFWWGLYLVSASKTDAWKICGPISISALFVFVSVKLMEDRQILNKGEKYREYQMEVGSSLLLLPPVVNKWLGKMLYSK